MEPSKFDELTKALATATSRRQALRRMGGILGGTALAGLFPGLAFASNSACAHFCNAVFGADTPAASKCTSDAAHHKGLCYTCGPASSGGTKPICCPENASGHCTSYNSATCCDACSTCPSGTCVSSCASGQVCLCNGTCATPCSNPGGPCSGSCGTGECLIDVAGFAHYCGNLNSPSTVECGPSLSGDCQCPKGSFCVQNGFCISVC